MTSSVLVSPVLKVTAVTLEFPGQGVLNRLSLDVEGGEIVRVLGGNQSGKTSLLDVVSGFVRPTPSKETTVEIRGQKVLGMAPFAIARKGVGRTFQTLDPPAGLQVIECIMLAAARGGKTVGLAFAKATELPLHRFVWELSGGSRRNLLLACDLGLGTQLLILDEPFAQLDSASREALRRALETRATDGVGILLMEHPSRQGAVTANRTWLLEGGRLASCP